ncbi:MAG TPA: DUF4238 domain-containing protein [Methylobacter sp.]|jgi:hypothetical protein
MRHHYIPCFYTKRWTGNDNRLCQYSRPHTKVVAKRVFPAGTGYVDDLYAIPNVPMDKKHLLETQFMKQIDQKASDILRKLENGKLKLLTPEERYYWATFLISLTQRSPEKIYEHIIKAQNVLHDVMLTRRDTYQLKRTNDDPETFEEFVQNAIDIGFFEQATMLLIQDTIRIPTTINLISKFYWSVFTFNDYNHRLLTSDRPIVMSNGLGQSDGYIALPLAPRTLFLAARTAEITRKILANPRLAEKTNEAVTCQAHQYVYGTDDAQLVFVEKRIAQEKTSISN